MIDGLSQSAQWELTLNEIDGLLQSADSGR